MTRWLRLSLALALVFSGVGLGSVSAEEAPPAAPEGQTQEPDIRENWVELMAQWERVRERGTKPDMTLADMVELEDALEQMMIQTVGIKQNLPFPQLERLVIERQLKQLQLKLVRLKGLVAMQIPGKVVGEVLPVRNVLWALQETFPDGFLPPPHLTETETPGSEGT